MECHVIKTNYNQIKVMSLFIIRNHPSIISFFFPDWNPSAKPPSPRNHPAPPFSSWHSLKHSIQRNNYSSPKQCLVPSVIPPVPLTRSLSRSWTYLLPLHRNRNPWGHGRRRSSAPESLTFTVMASFMSIH